MFCRVFFYICIQIYYIGVKINFKFYMVCTSSSHEELITMWFLSTLCTDSLHDEMIAV